MSTTRPTPPRLTMTLLAAIFATVIATLALLFAPPATNSAQAAIPIGPGYQIPNPYRDSIIGGYLAPDGSVLYCLEWGKESPTGDNDPVLSIQSTTQYAAWSHLEIARVNYIISTWGQTRDNEQAAAVAMAIWMRHPGTIEPFFSEHRFVRATIPNAELRARIAQRAEQINREADRFTPHARAAIGSIELHVDAEDEFSGEVRIVGVPSQAQGTLVLQGAMFEATQSPSLAGVQNGDVYAYRGIPSDDDFGQLEIAVDATFVMPGGPGDELVVWRTPDGFQDLGQASVSIPDFHFSLSNSASIDLTFAPQLVTRAARQVVTVGAPLTDELTVTMAPDSGDWRQLSDGTFVELDAWCQAYGPLSELPAVQTRPPADAPVFGEPVTVQLGGTEIHPSEQTVRATFLDRPKRAGHYTFVCGIARDQQVADASLQSLPTDYTFQHEYGLTQETTQVTAPLARTGSTGANLPLSGMLGVSLCVGVVLVVAHRIRGRKSPEL